MNSPLAVTVLAPRVALKDVNVMTWVSGVAVIESSAPSMLQSMPVPGESTS